MSDQVPLQDGERHPPSAGGTVTATAASAPAAAAVPESTGPTTSEEDQRLASEMRANKNTKVDVPSVDTVEDSVAFFDKYPQVKIDDDATQKYVLVQVNGKDTNSELETCVPQCFFVRGSKFASYHKDAARELVHFFREDGVDYRILGGGRIHHSSTEKTILVYGFSYGFPWENDESKHSIACDLLKSVYPGFEVSWTDEGY